MYSTTKIYRTHHRVDCVGPRGPLIEISKNPRVGYLKGETQAVSLDKRTKDVGQGCYCFPFSVGKEGLLRLVYFVEQMLSPAPSPKTHQPSSCAPSARNLIPIRRKKKPGKGKRREDMGKNAGG